MFRDIRVGSDRETRTNPSLHFRPPYTHLRDARLHYLVCRQTYECMKTADVRLFRQALGDNDFPNQTHHVDCICK